MGKKILCTFLLIIIFEVSIFVGYFLSKYYNNKKISTEKAEIIYKNNKDEELILEVEKEKIKITENSSEDNSNKVNNSNIGLSKDNGVYNKTSTPSVSKNNNSSVNKKKDSTTKNGDSSKSVIDTSQEKEMDNTTTKREKDSNDKMETNSQNTKQEETNKSVVIEYNEPDESSFKNDPSYIKLKKELFSTMSECKKMGTELWKQDKDNIAHSYCQSEYYKGIEAGIRLYIVYNDGTMKEYKK